MALEVRLEKSVAVLAVYNDMIISRWVVPAGLHDQDEPEIRLTKVCADCLIALNHTVYRVVERMDADGASGPNIFLMLELMDFDRLTVLWQNRIGG